MKAKKYVKQVFRGAQKIVNVCANVQPGEHVVIITEDETWSIANAIATAVDKKKAFPNAFIITTRKIDGEEPPQKVADAMISCDVFFSVVNTSITHTSAVRNAVLNGARGIIMTQFREHMLVTGGIEADFQGIAPQCIKLAKRLENSKKIQLLTENGTNLTFSAKDRRGNALTGIVKPGEFSTIPTIEANVSPLEGTAKGVIVADASIPYLNIGLLEEPVELKVENGMITSINGGYQAEFFKKELESYNIPTVYNIAELGIGLNPSCKFVGFMLEDEGVYGSAHIGIGTNITLGGNVKSVCHYDVIMKNATLIVDDVKIIDNGNLIE